MSSTRNTRIFYFQIQYLIFRNTNVNVYHKKHQNPFLKIDLLPLKSSDISDKKGTRRTHRFRRACHICCRGRFSVTSSITQNKTARNNRSMIFKNCFKVKKMIVRVYVSDTNVKLQILCGSLNMAFC